MRLEHRPRGHFLGQLHGQPHEGDTGQKKHPQPEREGENRNEGHDFLEREAPTGVEPVAHGRAAEDPAQYVAHGVAHHGANHHAVQRQVLLQVTHGDQVVTGENQVVERGQTNCRGQPQRRDRGQPFLKLGPIELGELFLEQEERHHHHPPMPPSTCRSRGAASRCARPLPLANRAVPTVVREATMS